MSLPLVLDHSSRLQKRKSWRGPSDLAYIHGGGTLEVNIEKKDLDYTN